MGSFIDMTGWVMKEHGIPESRLTVIKRVENRDKHIFWLCKCECGNELEIRGDQIRKGIAKSCGCYQKEIAAQNMIQVGRSNKNKISEKRINYVGQKIGKLTLIEPVKYEDKSHLYWKCKCQCGNYTIVSSDHLNSGHTKSCGCLHSGTEFELIKLFDKNNFNYSREYVFTDLLSNKNCPLRFDFAIFNKENQLVGLIECQGEQHYNPVDYFGGQEYFNNLIINDKKKKDYCAKHNIPLLCIRNKNLDINKILEYVKEILK